MLRFIRPFRQFIKGLIVIGAVGMATCAPTVQAQQIPPELRLSRVESGFAESLGAAAGQGCDETLPVQSLTPFASSVGNSGDNPLSNTKLTLTVTSELQFVTGAEQADRGAWTVQPGQAVLDLGTMAPGETVNWRIDVLAVAPGTATFTERLTCCGGASAENTCTLTVTGGPTNSPPVVANPIDDQTLTVGGNAFSVDLNDVFDDPDGDALEFAAASSDPSVATVSLNGTVLTVTPVGVGTTPIPVAADDGQDSATDEFDVTVEAQQQTGTITGTKFEDVDGNGVFDEGDPGLLGWNIEVLDATGTVVATGTTDPSGRYEIVVPPGAYTVREVQQAGWTQTAPQDDGTHTVTLDGGGFIDGLDFGNTSLPGAIHGIKIYDVDENGDFDPELGDVGLDGFTIQLYTMENVLVDEVVTHAMDLDEDGVLDPFAEQGLFWFTDVPPGTYRLVEVPQDGWERSFPLDHEGAHIVEIPPGGVITGLIFANVNRRFVADWGDLPDPVFDPPPPACLFAGINLCYTTRAPFGPVHFFDPNDQNPLRLGFAIDAEPNGQPDPFAEGDERNGPLFDEDGIGLIFLDPDSGTVDIDVRGPAGSVAFIDAWIDFDGNGILGDPGEMILRAVPVNVPSLATYSFTIPTGTDIFASTFARFRLSYRPRGFPTFSGGLALSGEVEDYFIDDLLPLDYGDAREDSLDGFPDFPQGYPVVLASDGAYHHVFSEIRLGERIDFEDEGQPTILASGDDATDDDDEDGIVFAKGFVARTLPPDPEMPDPAASGPLTYYAMVRGITVELVPLPSTVGKLDAWIDFNRDGDWDDAGEQVFANEEVQPVSGAPTDTLRFDVPPEADPGFTYARFRFSLDGNLDPTGVAPNGEVEDYLLQTLNAITNLQVINAVLPGGAPVGKQTATFDLYVDGMRVADDLASGTATVVQALPLSDAAPVVEIVPGAASDNGTPLFSSEVNFATESTTVAGANTLVLTGTEDGTLGVLLKKDVRPAAANAEAAEFFVAHAAPEAPPLDVRLLDDAGMLLADDLAFGTATGYQGLSPDVYYVEVLAADTDAQLDVFRLDLSQAAGTTRALLLTGQPSDASFALVSFDAAGNRVDTDVVTATETTGEVPEAFALHGNYPNPFNPQTTIRFDVAEATHVRLTVYDVLGRLVETLVDEPLAPGAYQAVFEAQDLPSGVYVYRVEMAAFQATRTMLLVK